MQDITTTIQTEQNKIIRDTLHDVFLVNGVADSGKTSTILQRIAYLLYSFRNKITADNCLILSPNNRFIDYISNVLPSLGEQTPLNLTITQFLQQYLHLPIENELDYFSRISQITTDTKTATIRSKSFLDFLRKATFDPSEFFQDIYYKKQKLISKEHIQSLYQSTPIHGSIQNRI
jgi:DNA helicase-2/ATP-dependent DNA helicase PcrA